MIPRAARWLNNLTVVRVITRRQRELVKPLDLQVEDQEMVSLDSRMKLTL